MARPCKKRNLQNKKQANIFLEQIKILNSTKGKEKKNKHLHVYFCEECKSFHIGNKLSFNWKKRHNKQI